MLLHMVFNIRCSDCNTELPARSLVHCVKVIIRLGCKPSHTGNKVLQSLHLMLNTICSNIQPVHLKMGV